MYYRFACWIPAVSARAICPGEFRPGTLWSAALIMLWLLVGSSTPARAELQVFASFENLQQIQSLESSPGVKLNQSAQFPAWEGNSLEVRIPETGGWIRFSQIPANWLAQEALLAFVWSQQPAILTMRLKDSAEGAFEKSFSLHQGANHLQLVLAEATRLNRAQLQALTLTINEAGIYYLDYFALDRYHPVLAERGRWDINYSLEVETPHTPWARPFFRGPIKSYLIADVADGRGVVELAQRLELDFKATTIGSSPGINKWGFGDFYEQRSGGGEFWKDAYSLANTYIADDLMNGPAYDLILWPGLRPWESYPIEVRQALRKRVEAGAGLVLFSPIRNDQKNQGEDPLSPLVKRPPIKSENDNNFLLNRMEGGDHSKWKPTQDHYITRGVPFDAFPWGQMTVPPSQATGQVLLATAQGTPVLAVQEVGKGRVVAFGYAEKGMIPEIQHVFETGLHYPYQEYLWALVARAAVWASRHEPEGVIEKLTADSRGLSLRISSPPPSAQVTVRVQNDFGETEDQFSLPAVSSTNPIRAPFRKPLSGGRHFLEARLLKDGKAIDWAITPFDVTRLVEIRLLKPEQDRIKVGAEVPIQLSLWAEKKTSTLVHFRLLDNYDRLLDERRLELSVAGESVQHLALSSTGALTHLSRIDCEVLVAGKRSDRKQTEFFVLQPRQWNDYDVVMYGFGPDPIPGIWPTIDRQMQRLQVSTLSSYTLEQSKHANYQIQAQTRISGQESPDGPARQYYTAMKKKYLETGNKMGLVRQFVLDDPGYRELIQRELREKTASWIPFSPMSYYVFEEPSLTCYGDSLDLCFSPHTLKAMRSWLQESYSDLARLNQQWGTQFSTWEAVIPDDAPQAQARGNYASWADHRTYMEKVYADCYAFVWKELKQLDPQGILLNSGTQVSGAHNGCDYSRLNQYTRHLNAYDGGNQLDFHRCFNPEVKISGGAGYGVLGEDVFYNFYNNLFKGANGGAYIFWQYSTLDPDLTMSQSGKDMEKGFKELRGEGIGKLVGQALPENNGIAIHYSYPSIHGSWIVDGRIQEEVSDNTSRTLDRFNANRDGWVKILKDLGLQFDFLAYGEVEKGGLLAHKYRALVLPMSVALSDQEVINIREFVRQGGILLSDALPGIMDQHCTFRPTRALQEVFGFQALAGNRGLLLAGRGETGLQTTTAQALSDPTGKSTGLKNSFGQGRAYYLNGFLDSYPQERGEGHGQATRDNLRRLIEDAGLKPPVLISQTTGGPVSQCATYFFNTGSTRLLGLLPEKSLSGLQRIQISLGGPAAIYDVRQKQYLGHQPGFAIEVERGVPRLFALIDKPVEGIQAGQPEKCRLGELVDIKFKVLGPAGFHSVAKITVISPKGETIPFYGKNEDIRDNQGSFRFRTALNDPPGDWTITITDVISGRQARSTVRIGI